MLVTEVLREVLSTGDQEGMFTASEDAIPRDWAAFLKVMTLVEKVTWQDWGFGEEAWWVDENDEGP